MDEGSGLGGDEMARLAFTLDEDAAVVLAAAQRLPEGWADRTWLGGRMPAGPDAVVQAPPLHLALGPVAGGFEGVEAGPRAWIGRPLADADGWLEGAARAGALLCNLMNIAAGWDEEFNDWYDTEHMPSLSALPGVISAARFKTDTGAPAYMALYFLTDAGVCQSDAWSQAAATPWTRRIQRFRTDNRRLAFVPLSPRRLGS